MRYTKRTLKLRTQIFLFLLVLGLAPLLLAMAISVPLVFDKLEQFYHKAYLEQLRADFRDLDQHITRRQEMVRLFAKLPEPGIALDEQDIPDENYLSRVRQSYAEWVNRVLFDHLDITQVIFIGSDGKVSLALNRNRITGLLESDLAAADLPRLDFLSAGLKVSPGTVLTSPINLDRSAESEAASRYMKLSFITPVITPSANGNSPELRGVVVFNIDVGGLAHVYNGIYWVQDNGEYLVENIQDDAPESNAFRDFPGLKSLFAKGELNLWEYGGQQVFWLPLFTVQDAGPLWVGRSVDASPIVEFTRGLEVRTVIVIGVLLLVVFLIARFIAVRAERVSGELIHKMSRVLEADEAVGFTWKRPEELRTLGNTLTRLAEKHVEDAQAVRAHTRALEDSNRYKSEFLANVSHELRTPLNSILLLSKMQSADDSELPEKAREQARVIHSAGKDLRSLIDTILDLSRIEAGKASLAVAPVELPMLLGEMVELMRPQFEEKHLRLELSIAADAPTRIDSDADKLRQILINFLSNALKFTQSGGCRLSLAQNRAQFDTTLPVAVSVRDSGIGIPHDKQAQVFEAFSQVDGSTSRRYGGTGLGLTISRELADLLGARILVHSTPGEGSTFTLLLPKGIEPGNPPAGTADSPRQTGNGTAASDEDSGLPSADYRGKRVLLVDDDIRNLLALTPVLEQWSLQVVAAGDGQEAIDTLSEDIDFDLILMDLMMPGMDGFETIRRIRELSQFARTPIVALTAKTADEDRDQALKCGANAFITKPVEPDALKQALDSHLNTENKRDG